MPCIGRVGIATPLLRKLGITSLSPLLPRQMASPGGSDSSGDGGLERVNQLISQAISQGAPAYNAGNIDQCAKIYKSTAQKIVEGNPNLPDPLQQGLKDVLSGVLKENDPDANAWALRRIFDEILEYDPPFLPQCADCLEDLRQEPFIPKTQIPDQPLVVNDGVMGGLSSCQYDVETKIMKGDVSLANNGGFASLRWRFQNIQNWSYAKGLYIKVKHSNPDKHTFKFLMKDANCERYRGSNYKVTFANPENSGDPILIPFSAFNQIEQMGRSLGALPIHPSSITEIGIMAIKPTVVGDFQIEVQEWGLFY